MIDVEDARDLDEAPDLDDEEQRERWSIKSDRAASWALRKLAAAEAEIARVTQDAADEIDALKAWRDAALAEPLRDINYFEGLLIDYRLRLEADNDALPKTYKVPGGTIARRKQTDVIEIVDRAAFITWAMDNGRVDLLKIETPITPLKEFTAKHDELEEGLSPKGQLVTDDGEIVPGVVHIIREDTYNAKPG